MILQINQTPCPEAIHMSLSLTTSSKPLRWNSFRQRNPKYKAKVYQAYRYNLEFDDSCVENPKDLKVKVFREADREWVRFVLMNRNSDRNNHDYDIVKDLLHSSYNLPFNFLKMKHLNRMICSKEILFW